MKIQKVFLFTAVFFFLFVGSLSAKNNKTQVFKKNSIENLIIGIESENPGLKKSAIYLAGKYKIKDVTKTLINLLEDEEDEAIRNLIISSLYQINVDNEKALTQELNFD